MKIIIGMSAAMMLAGCASIAETMETKEPSAIYFTTKTPREYRDCYVTATPMRGLTASEYGDGYIFVSDDVPGNAFTVMPKGEGSEVKVWGLAGTRAGARLCI